MDDVKWKESAEEWHKAYLRAKKLCDDLDHRRAAAAKILERLAPLACSQYMCDCGKGLCSPCELIHELKELTADPFKVSE